MAALLIGAAIYKQYSPTLFTFKQEKLVVTKKNEADTLETQRQNARAKADSIPIDSLGHALDREFAKPNTYEPTHYHK